MKIHKLFRVFLVCLSLIVLASTSFASSRHRYHTSLTRIDHNAEQKLFEISIQLFLHDLIPVLEKKFRARVDFEETKSVDELITKYLNEEFILTDKNGERKHLKWVGKETDVDSVWIYLETPSEESLENYRLQNTIFFESFQEQTNHVICRFESRKTDLVFKAGDKIKEISVNKSTERD